MATSEGHKETISRLEEMEREAQTQSRQNRKKNMVAEAPLDMAAAEAVEEEPQVTTHLEIAETTVAEEVADLVLPELLEIPVALSFIIPSRERRPHNDA